MDRSIKTIIPFPANLMTAVILKFEFVFSYRRCWVRLFDYLDSYISHFYLIHGYFVPFILLLCTFIKCITK